MKTIIYPFLNLVTAVISLIKRYFISNQSKDNFESILDKGTRAISGAHPTVYFWKNSNNGATAAARKRKKTYPFT